MLLFFFFLVHRLMLKAVEVTFSNWSLLLEKTVHREPRHHRVDFKKENKVLAIFIFKGNFLFLKLTNILNDSFFP